MESKAGSLSGSLWRNDIPGTSGKRANPPLSLPLEMILFNTEMRTNKEQKSSSWCKGGGVVFVLAMTHPLNQVNSNVFSHLALFIITGLHCTMHACLRISEARCGFEYYFAIRVWEYLTSQ